MKFNPYTMIGTNGSTIRNFLDAIKVDFNYWLFRNDDYYPECCSTASEVLYGFMSMYYDVRLVFGDYMVNYDPSRVGTHSWIIDKSGVIDFTVFQFLMESNKGNIPAHIDPHSLYVEYIFKYQKDVYIDNGPILFGYDLLINCELVKCPYITTGNESFFSYLDRISQTEEFKNRHERPIKFIEKPQTTHPQIPNLFLYNGRKPYRATLKLAPDIENMARELRDRYNSIKAENERKE